MNITQHRAPPQTVIAMAGDARRPGKAALRRAQRGPDRRITRPPAERDTEQALDAWANEGGAVAEDGS